VSRATASGLMMMTAAMMDPISAKRASSTGRGSSPRATMRARSGRSRSAAGSTRRPRRRRVWSRCCGGRRRESGDDRIMATDERVCGVAKRLHREGRSLREISSELAARGFVNMHGKPFAASSVNRMLSARRGVSGPPPFGYRLAADAGARVPMLEPDPEEQRAIRRIHELRRRGATLMAIRDAVRAMGFAISHETVRAVLTRER
jgi:hypothetical protein